MKAKEVKMKQAIIVKDDDGMETWSAFCRDEKGNTYFLLDNEYADDYCIFGMNNDYRKSYARVTANNCSPSERVIKTFKGDDFIRTYLDLTSLNGIDTYGICSGDVFGILSLDMYRRNRKNIKIGKKSFFLCTPNLTRDYAEKGYIEIDYNGDIDLYDDCTDENSENCIRPFFILRPETEVATAEKEHKIGISFQCIQRVSVELEANAKEIEQLKSGSNPFHKILKDKLESGTINYACSAYDQNGDVLVDYLYY